VSNKAILGLTANGFPTTPQMFEGIWSIPFSFRLSSWVVSPFRLCPFRVAAFKALGRHSVSGAMTCARTTAATDIDHVSHCFVEISCPKGRWNQISGLWFFATPKNDGVSSSVGGIFHAQHYGKVIKFWFQTTNQSIIWWESHNIPWFQTTNQSCFFGDKDALCSSTFDWAAVWKHLGFFVRSILGDRHRYFRAQNM
jgi:hypothetical protein